MGWCSTSSYEDVHLGVLWVSALLIPKEPLGNPLIPGAHFPAVWRSVSEVFVEAKGEV